MILTKVNKCTTTGVAFSIAGKQVVHLANRSGASYPIDQLAVSGILMKSFPLP